MVQAAKLVSHGAHVHWKCPTCNRTLGEVFERKVIVKAGDRLISFDTSAAVEQVCPRCSEISMIVREENAA